ncbi:MAG TPA: acyl CoA:acetate/3-ketoacid CoA transferase [Bacillota bacterium]|nr:acyl CoA:acetate/3-ketoacid CoA transferase [Bacillota bacterium]
MMSKMITAKQAAELIGDGYTVGASTVGLAGWAEEVAMAIEERYLTTGHPKNITLVHASASGDRVTRTKGTHHLGYEGLVKRLICGHTGQAPRMAELVVQDKIECYFFPQGVICQLWRAIAGNKPGVITKVGLGTFVDPRLEGAKVTSKTHEDLVKLIELEGQEWLFFKKFPIDVAIIRGTVADENGNLTMDKEAVLLEQLPLAIAAKNSGGIVIAQVERIAKSNTLHPKKVKVPGVLVDYIVVAQPENHMQTEGTIFNPALSGDIQIPMDNIESMELDERKIIARRAALELSPRTVTNLGVGIPDGVGKVAAEEGIIDQVMLTTELGVFGGIPASGADFCAAFNAEAVIEHPSMFDFYDGGGLDVAFLGMAQADQHGNVNVSKFGGRAIGPGGFINITQNAKKVVFCSTFTNGAVFKIEDGKLIILKEGKGKKFCSDVEQVTFSGKYSQEMKQPVFYVTERAVFTLEEGQLTLIEVAPGINIDRDILSLMDFQPRLSLSIKVMDEGIFRGTWGKLKATIEKKHYLQE